MTKPPVTIRRATAEDIASFSTMTEIPTTIAWCGEMEGRIIGLGGFARGKGRWVAFLDLTDEARPYKMTLMRAAIRAMAEARRVGIRFVFAEADLNEANPVEWMQSLGFELDPKSQRLYRWRA